jgi:hypothetical protein
MKEEAHHHPPVKHHEHATATVIHQHEDDTVLARWLRRGIEQGPKFWITLVGLIAGAAGVGVLVNYMLTRESTTAEAWMELAIARTAEQQLDVAKNFPESTAARWAELEAASHVFNQAFDALPNNRDAASPLFKRAYELYSKVYEKSAKTDPDVARLAAFGMARTLEASDDLKRAVEQYRFVATTWPGTDEAKQAAELSRALLNKRNVEYYEWLAKYKPPTMTLPPLGRGILGPDFPPPMQNPFPFRGAASPLPATELPADVFESNPAEPSRTPPPDSQVPPAPSPAQPGGAPASATPAPAPTAPGSEPSKTEPPKF